jgi:hypothetical protein
MKQLVFLTVLLSLFITVNAQIEEKMKAERVVKGAIFQDGQEIEGYIKSLGQVYSHNTQQYYPAPWEFQGNINFIPKDVFENTVKISGKLYKKYGPKDISGYRYEDLEFESVKYADMSAVGMNMIPKKMFLRRITNDKVSVFYHYDTPSSVVVGGTFEEAYAECAQERVVYRKGIDGKVKLITGIKGINTNDKDFADCPYVAEKKANGGYSGNHLDIILAVIEDYNTNCD